MYSIVEIKGKQYKVSPGAEVDVDRIDAKEGEDFSDIKVLLLKNDKDEVQIGTPYLDKVKVTAKVVSEVKTPHVLAVHYKPKSGYVKTRGQRQKFTKLKIEKIAGS